MTDWDLMVEYINNAMQAVDKAHEVTNNLRKNATAETFDEFRSRMNELIEHLAKLQTVLNHEGTFAFEELADRMSMMLEGHRPEYRRTPRMEETAES